ncbi:hypothetical protein [Streptomyces sp. NPDC004008]
MAETLGLLSRQQTTLTLVEMRQNRPELCCQHIPLTFQPAHVRPTDHRAESHELKICTPLGHRPAGARSTGGSTKPG